MASAKNGESWEYIPDTTFDEHVRSIQYDRRTVTETAQDLMQTELGQKMRLEFQRPELEEAFLRGEA